MPEQVLSAHVFVTAAAAAARRVQHQAHSSENVWHESFSAARLFICLYQKHFVVVIVACALYSSATTMFACTYCSLFITRTLTNSPV